MGGFGGRGAGSAYGRRTEFEMFPELMDGVVEVRKLDETIVHWVLVVEAWSDSAG
jgi:hypothetical protein